MTLQNEHILMEEAHRRVADKLREAELDRFGRQPRPRRRKARLAVALSVLVALVGGVAGMVSYLT